MRSILIAVFLGGAAAGLCGCGVDHADIFPNAPEGSFLKTGIGPGPTGPVGPTSGHTTPDPTGRR